MILEGQTVIRDKPTATQWFNGMNAISRGVETRRLTDRFFRDGDARNCCHCPIVKNTGETNQEMDSFTVQG